MLLAVLTVSSDVSAQYRSHSLDELVESSELVIFGTVVDESTYRKPILTDTFSSDGKGKSIKRIETWDEILTDYEIEITEVYKGQYSKSAILLTTVGGTLDGETLVTSESFHLATGLLFGLHDLVY